MSMIKCPECGQKISSLAGTCPHCGVAIRGNVRQCPQCKAYVMKTAKTCPECSATLPPVEETGSEQNAEAATAGKETKKKSGLTIIKALVGLILFCSATGGSYYYFHTQKQKQQEEESYLRLEGLTNPEFYQQFLIDYPQSTHCDDVRERMQSLIQENGDWNAMISSLSRNTVVEFMDKHPQSVRRCICENMLDSIDWADAIRQENPEAIDTYLSLHPEGQHVTEAASKKNELAMTKITPEDKSLVRGMLETFLNNGMGKQDTTVIRQCIANNMDSFCGMQHATPTQIAEYAQKKMAQDVIGLHYLTGTNMDVRRQTLDDSTLGYAVDFTIDETMARKDATQNTNHHYSATALLNAERKILRLTIR